eukprot:TRINITY_DN2512_c0_g5_i1.p1 TRINITY_DN2512_c0_g5~~TRINITY_DN2512_c0_g5_i1.p1  ORF type:complete len:506 (+),score=147.55 TRINITY_DN2512_c0_g5_i1:257-1774(+)
MKTYLLNKERGSLAIMKVQEKLAGSLAPVALSAADGAVNYGDILMLRNVKQDSSLSVDAGDFYSHDSLQVYQVTTCPDNNPYTRSAFRVVRYKGEDREYEEPDVLHYGEKFHLATHPHFHKRALYLYSKLHSTQFASKVTHRQIVGMSTKPSWDTVWQILPLNPLDRKRLAGDPVPVNAPVVVNHCATNNHLYSDGHMYNNVFGNEFEVCCAKKFDNHKVETAENHWIFAEGTDGVGVVTDTGTAPEDTFKPTGIIDEIRTVLAKRSGGVSKLKDLGKQFRFMDQDKGGSINREEVLEKLQTLLRGYGIMMTADDVDTIFHHFDYNNDGVINYDEFIRGIRGDMNDRRMSFVEMAYKLLDQDKNGTVTLDEVQNLYDVSQHPKVVSGEWTEKQAIQEFNGKWDLNGDDIVTYTEFVEYYNWISPSIDNDDYFELMMRNAWHISGGSGWCQNTSCRRVLVFHRDGNQTVEEIKNDLGIGKDDIDKMMENLRAQGFDPVRIALTFAG